MLNSCEHFKMLPIEIRQALKCANTFYTENYECYIKSISKKTIYIYNQNYILLLIVSKKYFFNYGYFPVEEYKWNNQTEGYNEHEFLNCCINYIKQNLNLMWLNHSETCSEFCSYPKDAITIPFGNYIIDLSKSEEEIWGNFHTKHRNSVRRSEKAEVSIIYGSQELLDDFYKLDILTRKRSNMRILDKQFYENIINNLKENTKIFVAYKNNEPQGAAIFYFNTNSCYYMYGASCDKPETGSMELLQWKAILYMKENQVKKFSFVGCRINEDEDSKYHGIQRFKSRFGGQLKKGYLFKVVFNRKYYKIYVLLLKLMAFLHNSKYKGDIIDQEMWKWIDINETYAERK